MSKFTFTGEHLSDNSRVTLEFQGETLSEVVRHFEYFLRGMGYHFEGQYLELTEEEFHQPLPDVDTIDDLLLKQKGIIQDK